jgi:hypothetical protein
MTEIYLTTNEPQSLMDEFSCSTKILDAEEVTKSCYNLNSEEQFKFSKNMNIFLWNVKRIQHGSHQSKLDRPGL